MESRQKGNGRETPEGAWSEAAERYELNWPRKRRAKELAGEAITGYALQPVRGEGKEEDRTENLCIEGDNLEVLKLLRKDYESKMKPIYIDPPYNTGSDFLYKDTFGMHANWLNMIYPRLAVARELLRDDGAIFISIDDNEVTNLIKVCDEKSEAYKMGYETICEVGKERIRRAGEKIRKEWPDADVDVGFKVLKAAEVRSVCL